MQAVTLNRTGHQLNLRIILLVLAVYLTVGTLDIKACDPSGGGGNTSGASQKQIEEAIKDQANRNRVK